MYWDTALITEETTDATTFLISYVFVAAPLFVDKHTVIQTQTMMIKVCNCKAHISIMIYKIHSSKMSLFQVADFGTTFGRATFAISV